MRTIAAFIIIFTLSFWSCEEPVDEVNPYKQEAVDWPSLADSPWPMFQHDPQHTGRSEYAGPSGGSIYKKVEMIQSEGSVVIGYDSNIIIGGDYRMFSFDYEGNTNWIYGAGTYSTPVITADSLVMTPFYSNFAALTITGDLKWKTPITRVWGLGTTIDKQGNVYFVDNEGVLNVLNSVGELTWQLSDDRILNGTDIAPAFSPDGNTLYLQGKSVSVLAVDINSRSIKWTFGDMGLYSSPAVDNAGSLYFIPGFLSDYTDRTRIIYSINEDGEINWQYDISGNTIFDNTEATIDHNGNIYFANDSVYSFTNSGDLRWTYGINENMCTVASLICDANNIIYVCTASRQYTHDTELLAIDQYGELLWSLKDTEERIYGPAPALSDNGTLIYPTWSNVPGKIIFIK